MLLRSRSPQGNIGSPLFGRISICRIVALMYGLLVHISSYRFAGNINVNYGLGQLTGGLPSLLANCPDKTGACIINGIQSAIGIGLIGIAGVGTFTGSFKRDEENSPYSVVSFSEFGSESDNSTNLGGMHSHDAHQLFKENIFGKHDRKHFVFDVEDNNGQRTTNHYKYHLDEKRYYFASPIHYAVDRKRVDNDGRGNDLYAYSINDFRPDYANQLHYTTDVNALATADIFGDLMRQGADTACLALEGAIVGRLQIANEADFSSIEDDCYGRSNFGDLEGTTDGTWHNYD